jgi:predicted nucleic acid-binding protein
MTTAAAVPDPVFVDTNILVFAAITSSPFHAEAFGQLDAFRQAGVELWISRQILREYLAVLSRPQPFSPPLSAATLIADVGRFQA